MNRILSIIYLFIINLNYGAYAQNLLPNGDFREQQTCIEFNQKCAPMGWRLTSADPPNYYREFDNKDSSVFNAWTAFVAYSFQQKQYREYLQAPILCPLIKGEKYKFSITLKPEKFAIKEFGVLFSDTSIITGRNILLSEKPSLVFTNKNYIVGRNNNWVTLTYDYTASGIEKYILIGNFMPDWDTEYKTIESKKFKLRIAYFVSKISLVPFNNSDTCDCSALIKRLRNDRYRHSLFTPQFFQDSLALHSRKQNPKVKTIVQTESIEVKGKDSIVNREIYFAFDKFDLDTKAKRSLDSLIKFLNQNTFENISILGHTDSIGTEKYNIDLSLKRAIAVKEYLVINGSVPSNLIVDGKGKSLPKLPNRTPEGRSVNRRVVITLLLSL